MRYLVNTKTKEHREYEGGFPTEADWRIVEADDDGWIRWEGGECPLPDDVKCHWRTISGGAWTHGLNSAELNWMGGQITHYRPVLETAEQEEPRRHGTAEEPAGTQQSVFDRLKHAVVAAQSLPAILAEINTLLPPGYYVTTREEQPAEDMSDCRNWRVGDVLEAVENFAFHLNRGQQYVLQEKRGAYVYVISSVQEYAAILPEKFRFHSRPSKK